MTTIRPATQGDLDDLARVFVTAFRSGYAGLLPDDVLATLDDDACQVWLHSTLLGESNGLRTTAAVTDDDTAIGFTRFGPSTLDPDPARGYVASLYVAPEAGGAGVGRALLRHALCTLAAEGRTAVHLWVFEANDRARHLYATEDFTPDGTRRTDDRWRVPEIRLYHPG